MLSEKDLNYLNECLEEYAIDEHAIKDVYQLHGYLTAIVSLPDAVMPSTWMPALWGGEENSPEWESIEHAERFMHLTMQLMNSIADELVNAPHNFRALFIIVEIQGQELVIPTGWKFGYLRGVELSQSWELPVDLQERFDAMTQPLSEEDIDKISPEWTFQKAIEIEETVKDIHACFLEKREHLYDSLIKESRATRKQQSPVVSQKIGRNELCPCGSGKKYKKCCLH